ncbi:hypothetical protein D3C81_2294270 [compost metagenome]
MPVPGVRAGNRPRPWPRPSGLLVLTTAGILASGMLCRTLRSEPTLTPPTSLDRLRPTILMLSA